MKVKYIVHDTDNYYGSFDSYTDATKTARDKDAIVLLQAILEGSEGREVVYEEEIYSSEDQYSEGEVEEMLYDWSLQEDGRSI